MNYLESKHDKYIVITQINLTAESILIYEFLPSVQTTAISSPAQVCGQKQQMWRQMTEN